MIDDLSKTLRAILTQRGLPEELSSAQIVFDHPSEKFNPQQTTIDLFLYDIREDLELRSNTEIVERKNGKVIMHRPPLRVACSYLVTAWPVGGADLALQEQRLLSQVLYVFSGMPTIPATFLQEALKGQSPPLPMVTALVDPQKNLSEFWTALGSQLRPSITLTATIAIDAYPPQVAPMVVSEEIRLRDRSSGADEKKMATTPDDSFRIGGRVAGAGEAPIAGASVELVGQGLWARTDAEGYYLLGMMKAGAYKLRVKAGTKTKEIKINVPPLAGKNFDVQLG